MNTAKVIRQLRKVSDEKFVAAGKFVPCGVVMGTALGGALGGAIPAAAAGALASRISRRKAKGRELEIPRVAYVGVTDSEVVLLKGTSKMMVAPTRPSQVLSRWPRSEVKVIPKRGLANVVAEFHVPGAERPIGLVYRRLDASAKDVVRLLSAHDHAHDRLSPVDVDEVALPTRNQPGAKRPAPKRKARARSTAKHAPTQKPAARKEPSRSK